MYVFWEPSNAADLPVFVRHRQELEEFAESVADADVAFHSVSYSILWDQWEAESQWVGMAEHVASLRQRYELSVPL